VTRPPEQTCLDPAAILVASDVGAVDRLRARHRPRADGACAGCGPGLVRWPCVHVTIAERAAVLRRGRTS
jgi:hypothetical protein